MSKAPRTRPIRTRSTLLALAIASVAVLGITFPFAGCNSLNCTDIGCEDQVKVELAGDVPAFYTVVFEVPGEEPVEFSCEEVDCEGIALHFGAPPEIVVAVLVDGDEVASERFFPDYRTDQPNGPGCPPTCRFAMVSMEIVGNAQAPTGG